MNLTTWSFMFHVAWIEYESLIILLIQFLWRRKPRLLVRAYFRESVLVQGWRGKFIRNMFHDLIVDIFRRKTRSLCCPWTSWSLEISNPPSCPGASCSPSTAQRGGMSSKTSRWKTAVRNPKHINIIVAFQTLDLSCETQDDVDSWKASFLRAGVYPEKSNVGALDGGEEGVSWHNDNYSAKKFLVHLSDTFPCFFSYGSWFLNMCVQGNSFCHNWKRLCSLLLYLFSILNFLFSLFRKAG